jgi:hypothetical protein
MLTRPPPPPGLKLLIALSDRYALGFWSTDCYATHLNIVQPGSSGAQKVADASKFYTDEWTISMFEKRLAHIMKHSNALMGGRTWAELESVIFAVEREFRAFFPEFHSGCSRF